MTSNASEGRRRRPTINDIARLANVSKKTVSRVINNSPAVRADTRERVQAVIREQGYAPDPHARGLALGRALAIGLIWTEDDNPLALELQLGILDRLRGSTCSLTVFGGRDVTPESTKSFLQAQALAGVILAPGAAGAIAGGAAGAVVAIDAAAAASPREAGWRAADRLLSDRP